MDQEILTCPICKSSCSLLDAVDFNKSCSEPGGRYLPRAGIPISYALCNKCGFCFAPELYEWPLSKFEESIYNDDYILVDPEYIEIRPKSNADVLRSMFPNLPSGIRHLDYGGGNGLLVKLLRESNWQSASYDPFVDRSITPAQLGKFDLITAYEVFEHVPDPWKLMSDLRTLLSDDGLVVFSTLISDGNIHPGQKLSWWYASPRNGHISLFSRKALVMLAQESGFTFASCSAVLHALFRGKPSWASHLIRTA